MSTGHNRHFLTFIDDYSKNTQIYFMKRKLEVLDCLKEFVTTIKKQSDYNIRTLRSDQSGQYTSNYFKAFCKQQGIRHQTTPSYTPHLNGMAKRKN
jgi:transposase InsO family protein